ncbi:MAG: hypothetical protein CYG60_21310 [Actinobacteria bacterium]|nr:MAG: hypothetical protein CYG60_21310 [Actinomycetota bacterium]
MLLQHGAGLTDCVLNNYSARRFAASSPSTGHAFRAPYLGMLAMYKRGLEEHITEKTGTIPVVGEKTPNFELPDEQGRIFNLARELEAGPIVLVFYRGDW